MPGVKANSIRKAKARHTQAEDQLRGEFGSLKQQAWRNVVASEPHPGVAALTEQENDMIFTSKPTTETNDMNEAVARTVDYATNNVHKAIDAASDAARPAVHHIAARTRQAVDKLAGAATQAAETLEVKGGQLRDARSRFTESCGVYSRDKPFTSLGIAVAGGFLLSWLLRCGRDQARDRPSSLESVNG